MLPAPPLRSGTIEAILLALAGAGAALVLIGRALDSR